MISGLIVYLTDEIKMAETALLAINRQSALELGPQQERRLPLVLETTTSAESQELTDWLNDLPGVEHVDVAFVHLDEPHTTEPALASKPTSNRLS